MNQPTDDPVLVSGPTGGIVPTGGIMAGIRAAQAARTRQKIIDSATALFVERGYERTSVDDIIERSGTSKGAVYHQFTGKRQIFEACLRESQSHIIAGLEHEVDLSQPAWERAEQAMQTFLLSYVKDPRSRTLLSEAAGVLGSRRAHEVDQELTLPLMTALLADLIADGTLVAVDVPLAVRIMMAAICETATAIAASPDPHAAAADAGRVLLLMFSGLRSRELVA